MLLDKLSARRHERVDSASGTETRRFEERSIEVRVFARGASEVMEMEVRALSARDRCLRYRHFVGGRLPMRFEPCEELNGIPDTEEPRLLPESERRILCDL